MSALMTPRRIVPLLSLSILVALAVLTLQPSAPAAQARVIARPANAAAAEFRAVAVSARTAAARARTAAHRTHHARRAQAAGSGGVSFSSAVYRANENAGQFAVTIERTNTNGPETVYYGVTNKSSQAGNNFDKIGNSEADFAPGQSTAHVQRRRSTTRGSTGRCAPRAPTCTAPIRSRWASPSQAIIDLLQNDPLRRQDPQNPLGYHPDADQRRSAAVRQLVRVRRPVARRQGARPLRAHQPRLGAGAAHDRLLARLGHATASGCGTSRRRSLASTVEKYLADAEVAQPNTTVALSTYSLVHGACESPNAIKSRYENWITQLAHGIGNFRVVLYLEEDSLIETHCLSPRALQTRLSELAYAVKHAVTAIRTS